MSIVRLTYLGSSVHYYCRDVFKIKIHELLSRPFCGCVICASTHSNSHCVIFTSRLVRGSISSLNKPFGWLSCFKLQVGVIFWLSAFEIVTGFYPCLSFYWLYLLQNWNIHNKPVFLFFVVAWSHILSFTSIYNVGLFVC